MPRGKIEYKGPWGGVNTGVPATYLGPNEFPLLQNFSTYGNELKSRPVLTNLASANPAALWSGNIAELWDNSVKSPIPFLISYGANGAGSGVYQMSTVDGTYSSAANGGFPIGISFNKQPVYYWVTYAGVCYHSGFSNIYSLTYGSPSVGATVTSSYGGVYLTELAEHILVGYMYNFNGAPGYARNTLIWSGSANPTVYDPATDSTAGNTTFHRVYCINGFYNNGYSLYITHPHGIKQGTPTGNSTAPFNFQDFYIGEFGVGNMYAYSLAGRGDTSFFIAADDVKMITSYGVQNIGGNSKLAIYNDLQSFITNDFSFGFDPTYSANSEFGKGYLNQAVVGSVIPSQQRGYVYPNYTITIPTNNGADTIIWMYLYQEDKWIKWYCAGARIGQFKMINEFSLGAASIQNQYATALNGSATAAKMCYFDAITGFNTESSSEVDFRIEDQDGKFFQCARIRVTYRDLGVCPVTFSLYNVNEDGTYNNPAVQKTINLGTVAADGNIKQVYTDFVATGLFTQLKVTRAANAGACSIIKVQLLEEGADNLEVV